MTKYVMTREFVLMWCVVLSLAILVAVAMAPKQPHLLVGYGCEGSNGQPMYYTEEPVVDTVTAVSGVKRNRHKSGKTSSLESV